MERMDHLEDSSTVARMEPKTELASKSEASLVRSKAVHLYQGMCMCTCSLASQHEDHKLQDVLGSLAPWWKIVDIGNPFWQSIYGLIHRSKEEDGMGARVHCRCICPEVGCWTGNLLLQ